MVHTQKSNRSLWYLNPKETDGMGSVKRAGRSRHTMSASVCGLDVHKDSTYATILNSEGKIINQTRMTNEKVLSYLSHFKVQELRWKPQLLWHLCTGNWQVKGLTLWFRILRRRVTSRKLELKVTS